MTKQNLDRSAPKKHVNPPVRRLQDQPQPFSLSNPQNDILALQDAAGNQAVSQLLHPRTEKPPVEGKDNRTKPDLTLSGGRAIEPSLRAFMESRFEHDFSQVRIHNNAQVAHAVNANAFTIGTDVVMGGGQSLDSIVGKRLLAHELAHVVQQSRGGTTPAPLVGGHIEQAADQAATMAVHGSSPVQVAGASGVGLARQPKSLNMTLNPQSMTDEELKQEIALIRQWLLTNPTGSSERARLENVHRILMLTAFQRKLVQDEKMAAGIMNNSTPVNSQGSLNLVKASIGLVNGFLIGTQQTILGETWDVLNNELSNSTNIFAFLAGVPIGAPAGASESLRDNLSIISVFVDLPSKVEKLSQLIRDEVKLLMLYPDLVEVRLEQAGRALDIIAGLSKFVTEIERDPAFLIDQGHEVGLFIGRERGKWLKDFIGKTPFEKGEKVGHALGYVAFEVALLFLGLGAGKVSTIALKSGNFGQVILARLKKIPSLQKFLQKSRQTKKSIQAGRAGGEAAQSVADTTKEGASLAKLGTETAEKGTLANQMGSSLKQDVATDVTKITHDTSQMLSNKKVETTNRKTLKPKKKNKPKQDLSSDYDSSVDIKPEARQNDAPQSSSSDKGRVSSRTRRDTIKERSDFREAEAVETLQISRRETVDIERQIKENEARIESIRRGKDSDANLTDLLRNRKRLKEKAIDLIDERKLLGSEWADARRIGRKTEAVYYERLTQAAGKRSGHTSVRARGQDELYGSTSTDLTVEHIVPRSRIAEMPGFERLSWDRQVELFDWEPNLRLTSRSANSSRSNYRYEDWPEWQKYTSDREKIIDLAKLEKELEQDIQRMIKSSP